MLLLHGNANPLCREREEGEGGLFREMNLFSALHSMQFILCVFAPNAGIIAVRSVPTPKGTVVLATDHVTLKSLRIFQMECARSGSSS